MSGSVSSLEARLLFVNVGNLWGIGTEQRFVCDSRHLHIKIPKQASHEKEGTQDSIWLTPHITILAVFRRRKHSYAPAIATGHRRTVRDCIAGIPQHMNNRHLVSLQLLITNTFYSFYPLVFSNAAAQRPQAHHWGGGEGRQTKIVSCIRLAHRLVMFCFVLDTDRWDQYVYVGNPFSACLCFFLPTLFLPLILFSRWRPTYQVEVVRRIVAPAGRLATRATLPASAGTLRQQQRR